MKFEWNEACEKNFQELKDRLVFVPVLILLRGSEGYVVYCDTLRKDFDCVFMQQSKVIAYASK